MLMEKTKWDSKRKMSSIIHFGAIKICSVISWGIVRDKSFADEDCLELAKQTKLRPNRTGLVVRSILTSNRIEIKQILCLNSIRLEVRLTNHTRSDQTFNRTKPNLCVFWKKICFGSVGYGLGWSDWLGQIWWFGSVWWANRITRSDL